MKDFNKNLAQRAFEKYNRGLRLEVENIDFYSKQEITNFVRSKLNFLYIQKAKKIFHKEQQLKKTQEKLKNYENGFKGACATCENVGELNIKLEQQLKEAENVIVGLSNYYDLNSNAWSECEYKFLLDAKEYIDKYKGDS